MDANHTNGHNPTNHSTEALFPYVLNSGVLPTQLSFLLTNLKALLDTDIPNLPSYPQIYLCAHLCPFPVISQHLP